MVPQPKGGRGGRADIKCNSPFRTGTKISSRNRIALTICSICKSVPFTTIRARKPGTYWYQRWLWRSGTRIFVRNIPSGKTGLPFQTFSCSWKFSTVKSNFPETFCKWLTTPGHQSISHLAQNSGNFDQKSNGSNRTIPVLTGPTSWTDMLSKLLFTGKEIGEDLYEPGLYLDFFGKSNYLYPFPSSQ